MSKFKYHERSADTVKARANQKGGSYDSPISDKAVKLKIKEGENNLRILPPTWDFEVFGDNWAIEIYTHYNIGPDKSSYLCIDEMRKKYPAADGIPKGKCPICAARRDAADDEEAKALSARKGNIAYVVNRDEEKLGPQVWTLGWTLERDIQARSTDKKTGAVIPLDHPEEGYDISFIREGTKRNTKYVAIDIARDESMLAESEKRQQKWLDYIQEFPLSDMLIYYEPSYIEDIFMARGGSAADREDDAEDDRPSRSKKAKRGRDVEEEEEEETDRRPKRRALAEEEEEETAPKSNKRPSRDEEEGEEEAPKRPKRRDPDEDEEESPKAKRKPRDEEEEEVEERPRLKKRPSRDEEEEEEEEPAPKSAKRRVAEEEEDDIPFKGQRAGRGKEQRGKDEEEEEAPPKRAADRAKESLKKLGGKK